MANNSTNTNVTTNKSTPTIVIDNWCAFRPAILARNRSNNRKAIDNTLMQELGLDTSYLQYWKQYVHQLYKLCKEFTEASRKSGWTKKEQASRESVIFASWKEVMTFAEKDYETRTIKAQPTDAHDLISAYRVFMPTDVGTREAENSETLFRKFVETLLGVRAVANEMLTAEEADLIDAKTKAVKALASAEDRIDITKEEIRDVKKKIAAIQSKEVQEYVTENILKPMQAGLKELEKSIPELKTARDNAAKAAEEAYKKLSQPED